MHFIINNIKQYLLLNNDTILFSIIFKSINIISIYFIVNLYIGSSQPNFLGIIIQYVFFSLSLFLSIFIALNNFNLEEYGVKVFGGFFSFYILACAYYFIIKDESMYESAQVTLVLFYIFIFSYVTVQRAYFRYFYYFSSKLINKKVKLFFINNFIAEKRGAYPFSEEFLFDSKEYKELGDEAQSYLNTLDNKIRKVGDQYNISAQGFFEYFILDVTKNEVTEQDKKDFNYALNLDEYTLYKFSLIIIVPLALILPIYQLLKGEFLACLLNLLLTGSVSLVFALLFYVVHESIESKIGTLYYFIIVVVSIYVISIFELAKSNQHLFSYELIRWFASAGLLMCYFISLMPSKTSSQKIRKSWLLYRIEIIKAGLTIVLGVLFVLYNPFLPIYLYDRNIWITLDWIAEGSVVLMMILMMISDLKGKEKI